MNRFLVILAFLLGCFLSGHLSAQDKPQQDPEVLFRFADTDKDGKLSKEEFRKLMANAPRLKDNPRAIETIFQLLDTNRDGQLSLEEFKKVRDLQNQGQKPSTPKKPSENNPGAKAPTGDQIAFFEKKIRPVLAANCYSCHSAEAEKLKGGLALDTREGIRKGGDSGPAIVPGDVKRSLLLKAIRHEDEGLKMPPKKKLAADVIADFEQWVRLGAADPRDGAKVTIPEIDIEKGRQFWAFQPPRKTTPPQVKDAAWPRSDIDRFLLAEMESKGVKPVADADARTLLRRVYYDLIGLPPTPEEMEAFVNDPSPQAFEKVVDRLLASSHFGERWGRHWLDVARYAESSGKQANFSYPQAWRYRDYVIAAFNSDKPYDQFIREQLAGDLLPSQGEEQKAEQLIATGFLAIGPKAHNERNRQQFLLDLADEQIDVTSQAFLGLTIACARCHDHKFDPIPTKDYYALTGIFRSTETCYGTIPVIQNVHPAPLLQVPASANLPAAMDRLSPTTRERLEKQVEDLKKSLSKMSREEAFFNISGIRLRAQQQTLQSLLNSFEADGTPKSFVMGVRERSPAADSRLYHRGELDKAGEVVPRGAPQVLCDKPLHIKSGSGRKELAEWMASPNNPLTARVMVNRVWLHLFGRGLVPTPDNFGAAGQPPSHPLLLDHLALSFIGDGWSVKKLIRQIMLSRAYWLSSQFHAANNEIDPDNTLVWRRTQRRLDAESLRDSVLCVSGQLDRKPPRASVIGQTGEGFAQAALRARTFDQVSRQRTVYLPIQRDMLPEVLTLFDFAEPSMIISERATTTVPAQALYWMNNPFVIRHAETTADRLLARSSDDPARIKQAYLLFFGRVPTSQETEAATGFLQKYQEVRGKDKLSERQLRRASWAALCQAFIASAEFQYIN